MVLFSGLLQIGFVQNPVIGLGHSRLVGAADLPPIPYMFSPRFLEVRVKQVECFEILYSRLQKIFAMKQDSWL